MKTCSLIASAGFAVAFAGSAQAAFRSGSTFFASLLGAGANLYEGTATWNGDNDLGNGLELAGVLSSANGLVGEAHVLADAEFSGQEQIDFTIQIISITVPGSGSVNPVGTPAPVLTPGYTVPPDGDIVNNLGFGIGADSNGLGLGGIALDFGFDGAEIETMVLSSAEFVVLTTGLAPGGPINPLEIGTDVDIVGGDLVGTSVVEYPFDFADILGGGLFKLPAQLSGYEISGSFDVTLVPSPGTAAFAGVAGLAVTRRRR